MKLITKNKGGQEMTLLELGNKLKAMYSQKTYERRPKFPPEIIHPI